MKKSLTEAQEQIVNEEIQRRDVARENTYINKFGEFKSDLVNTLEDFLGKYIQNDIGDITSEDIALVRMYKPLLDNILHAAANHLGASVSTINQTEKTNAYGFPDTVVPVEQHAIAGEPPQGYPENQHDGVEPTIQVDPNAGTISEENDKLRDALQNTVDIVQSMEDKIVSLQKQLLIYESMAGMSKDVIERAITELGDRSLEDLKANNHKAIHDYVSSISNHNKGLSMDDQNGLGPINEAVEMLGSMTNRPVVESTGGRKFNVPGISRKIMSDDGYGNLNESVIDRPDNSDVGRAIKGLQQWNHMSKFG